MSDYIDRAQRYGLSPRAAKILLCVGGWFNSRTFPIDGTQRRIGSDHEPSIRRLCESVGVWSSESREEFESLHESGYFKSESRDERVHLAGQRCGWIPTQRCLSVIEDIIGDGDDAERIRPPWATDRHTSPPLYRDGGTEGLAHRKSVMVAVRAFERLGWVHTVGPYPTINVPVRPDARIWTQAPDAAAYIEGLSLHNDRDAWIRKFTQWSETNAPPRVWIYQNRRHMVAFWNHLIRHDVVVLDGGKFGRDPNNWSPERVNDRVLRSRTGRQDYSSTDICWTVAGLLQAGQGDVHEWARQYGIINTQRKGVSE